MNLKESLLWGMYAYGFEKSSVIQQRAILPCIKEYDVIIKLSQVLARQLHLLNGWRLSSRRPKHNIGPCQRTGLTDTKSNSGT